MFGTHGVCGFVNQSEVGQELWDCGESDNVQLEGLDSYKVVDIAAAERKVGVICSEGDRVCEG